MPEYKKVSFNPNTEEVQEEVLSLVKETATAVGATRQGDMFADAGFIEILESEMPEIRAQIAEVLPDDLYVYEGQSGLIVDRKASHMPTPTMPTSRKREQGSDRGTNYPSNDIW